MEEILIVLFVAILACSYRKIFLTKLYFHNGTYNGFLNPSIIVSDIVIFFILFNITIKYLLSQYITRVINYATLSKNDHILSLLNRDALRQNLSRETFLMLTFWLWVMLSVFWAPFKLVALYKALYFSEILIFFIMVYYFALKKASLYKHIKMAIINSQLKICIKPYL
jgi:hypothetical protein